MGYTHYFEQKKSATPEQWEAITAGFNALRTAALITKHPFPIQREYDVCAEPEVTKSLIAFNGIEDDGHETMILERKGKEFQFCKTARKPYDFAVVCLLILAHHHAPDVWEISSDGDEEEWHPVLEWMNSLGMGTFSLPPRVSRIPT